MSGYSNSSYSRGKDIVSTRRNNEGFVAGVYPLLPDETCWFLAADFDKQDWQRHVRAFLTTCREKREAPRSWSDYAQATAVMYGSSFLNPCLRRPADWAPF